MAKLKGVPHFLHGSGITNGLLNYIRGTPFKYVSRAKTYNQARGAYSACKKEDSDRSFVNLRAMVKLAGNFHEALEVLSETRLNSPEANEALRKVELYAAGCNIADIRDYITEREESKMGWDERHRLLALWNKLSLESLSKNVTTPDSFLKAYRQAPPRSPVRMTILEGYVKVASKNEIKALFKEMYKKGEMLECELGVLAKNWD